MFYAAFLGGDWELPLTSTSVFSTVFPMTGGAFELFCCCTLVLNVSLPPVASALVFCYDFVDPGYIGGYEVFTASFCYKTTCDGGSTMGAFVA